MVREDPLDSKFAVGILCTPHCSNWGFDPSTRQAWAP